MGKTWIQVRNSKSNISLYVELFFTYRLLDTENIRIILIALTLKLDIILDTKNKMLAYLISVVFYLADPALQKVKILPMLEQVS